MRIVDARWSPRRNQLVIECECGTRLKRPANRWKVTCDACGASGHLADIRARGVKLVAAPPEENPPWEEAARGWLELSAEELRDEVRDRIRGSFDGVRLGDGISLSETVAIDEYWTDPDSDERRRRRALDTEEDWEEVGREKFVSLEGMGGPAFIDAEGYHFYLPAAMMLYLERPSSSPEESLRQWIASLFPRQEQWEFELRGEVRRADGDVLGRDALVDESQRAAIALFVFYLAYHDADWSHEASIALDTRWGRELP